MLNRPLLTTAFGLALPFLVGCGGGGTSMVAIHATGADVARQALGAVDVSTFESIIVNVDSVRVRIEPDDQAGEGGDSGHEDGWYDLNLEKSEGFCPLDLVQLTTGGDFLVAKGEVPSGTITQIRFVLNEDQGYATYPNSDEQVPVRVPSGSQSGLKLTGAAVVLAPDQDYDFKLQFDAEASIHPQSDGSIRVQPVIHLKGVTTEQVDDTSGEPGVQQ